MRIAVKTRRLVAATLGLTLATVGFAQRTAPPVPQLVIRDGVRIWLNTQAFGPVPATLARQGASICGVLNTSTQRYRAGGYHPRALNPEGKPFPGGGYFCVPEK